MLVPLVLGIFPLKMSDYTCTWRFKDQNVKSAAGREYWEKGAANFLFFPFFFSHLLAYGFTYTLRHTHTSISYPHIV